MFANRFQREAEIKDAIIELFRNGSIRSTGDDLIEISVDYNSVSLSINRDALTQIIRESGAAPTQEVFQSARML